MRLALLCSLLLLPSLPALQDPSVPPDPEQEPLLPRPKVASEREAELGAALGEALNGAWQMKRLVGPGFLEEDGDYTRGFALFSDGFVSIILHLIERDALPDDDELIVQASVSRYEIRSGDVLQAVGVLGHNTLEDAEVTVEPAGTLREFRVLMPDPNELILTRPDGLQFVFVRVSSEGLSGEIEQRFEDARRGRTRD